MLKQSFTADNFETIFDIESRKNSIKNYLGEEYCDILSQIKVVQDDLANINRKKASDRTDIEKELLVENKRKKDILTEAKKNIRHSKLEIISKNINNKDFRFTLKVKDDDKFVLPKLDDKRDGVLNEQEANKRKAMFFAIKQLQYNIRKTFGVKQSSRHLILSQIKLLLNESNPKYVIRTDITRFFESIPQDKLFSKINDNTLLSSQSKKFIRQILNDYNSKKDTTKIDQDKGIPRGIGISSYLSELYLKEVDNKLQNLSDVVFYARYVDDIFIIISPSLPKKDIDTYFIKIKEVVSVESLELKDKGDSKCSLLDLTVPNMSEKVITYLGYGLHIKRDGDVTSVKFSMSDDKKGKIKNRITQAFNHFNNTNKYGVKNAKDELLLALCFLSANTKLSGAKSRVKTGIFYSNDLLDNEYLTDIEEIDAHLNSQQLLLHSKQFPDAPSRQLAEDKIKKDIQQKISFAVGFLDKTYRFFKLDDMKKIKRILK
ncbi:antiviral reverse transcriptase Drt3a [Bacteroides neonati]|uniref:antiviral reverse transcriptase Drt3a n=1 Tax=Bacteroides neonati TaxID=1347393 RepID=UPI0004B9A903|nr:antiviral reverse transcriptase Drt3a [Bacteroides neonati]